MRYLDGTALSVPARPSSFLVSKPQCIHIYLYSRTLVSSAPSSEIDDKHWRPKVLCTGQHETVESSIFSLVKYIPGPSALRSFELKMLFQLTWF